MFKRIVQGISRTSNSLLGGLKAVIGKQKPIDPASLEELEDALIMGDCGINATQRIVDAVRNHNLAGGIDLSEAVTREMVELLAPSESPLEVAGKAGSPFVMLIVGVNGAGKTTTIAKLGRRLKESGKSVMFAAGDTFRAAAVEQLTQWGERLDIPVISQAPGADPASVIYDACAAASARGIEVLIADTAGRLHTQANLMAELEKVKRVVRKFDESAPHETMLIIDSTMGQNALSQAKLFHDQIELDSLTLTKLDGTAKGGIVFALADELKLPIRFIGLGESYDDLQTFNAQEFAAALMTDTTLGQEEVAVE